MNRAIRSVGIVGAGTMGSALAQKFAQEGLSVILIDKDDQSIKRAEENIRITLNQGVERGLFSTSQAGSIISRVSTGLDYHLLGKCDLTLEAVFEDRDVKFEVLERVSRIVDPEAIIATNTSSFLVSDLSQAVVRPERFLGLHFFYHAAMNRLVEVVRGGETAEDAFHRALDFMQRCGKDPIVCGDSHGFVVNRFFVPWLNEAVRIHEEGLATTTAIDAVCRVAFGCGMGPFALMNATGVSIAFHAQKTLETAFGSFYQPAGSLAEQAEINQPWLVEGDEDVIPSVGEKIADRMLGTVFLVCGQLLDKMVCTAGDLNRGARIGLRWQKGPMEIFHGLGEGRVRTLSSAVAGMWKLPDPPSLNTALWQPDFIHTGQRGSVGVLTINRPEDLNALNPILARQLGDAFIELDIDSQIEKIIIQGRGKAFMAGADIRFFIDNIEKHQVSDILDFTRSTQKLLDRIDRSDKIVIALVTGLALGGGLELALAADVIFASGTAVFAFPETGIGIYPGLGGTQRTVQRIGEGLSKYLIYTGDFLRAGEALEIGLVDAVLDWEDLPSVYGSQPIPHRVPIKLAGKWLQIEELFDTYTIDEFLDEDQTLAGSLEPDRMGKLVSRVRSKAPLALQKAENLINRQAGPASELEPLASIFTSNDALSGLKSVGTGRPPVFRGT